MQFNFLEIIKALNHIQPAKKPLGTHGVNEDCQRERPRKQAKQKGLAMKLEEILGDELSKLVLEKLDGKKLILDDGTKILVDKDKAIPPERLKEVVDQRNELKKLLEQRDKQLEELGKSAGLSEDLKKQLETMKTESARLQKESDDKIKNLKIDSAIEIALAGKTKYSELLKTMVDRSGLTVLENGSVHGIEDQVKILQEKYKELFGEKQIAGKTPPDGKSSDAKSKLEQDYEQAVKDYGRVSPQAIKVKMLMQKDLQKKGEAELI